MACTWPCCILGINTLSAYIWFESPDMPCEKVARLHNSFVSLMSPVAGCTCFCCRSSTQQIDAILSVTWLPGDAGWRALVCLGPTLGSQLRMLTLLFVSSRVWSRHVAARYLSVSAIALPSSTHTHTYTCTFTHSTFTHDSITHTQTHTHTYPIFTHLCLCTHSFHQQHFFFTRKSFVHLTSICISCTHTHTDPPPSLVSFLPFPSHLHLSLATCWKKLTCGVIRSFNSC